MLGSNDAIVSTSSLMIGVAAADAPPRAVLVAGVAGLTAGAMSMAVGEFVSVSSQHDAEAADIAKESAELVEIGRDRENALRQSSPCVTKTTASLQSISPLPPRTERANQLVLRGNP